MDGGRSEGLLAEKLLAKLTRTSECANGFTEPPAARKLWVLGNLPWPRLLAHLRNAAQRREELRPGVRLGRGELQPRHRGLRGR